MEEFTVAENCYPVFCEYDVGFPGKFGPVLAVSESFMLQGLSKCEFYFRILRTYMLHVFSSSFVRHGCNLINSGTKA